MGTKNRSCLTLKRRGPARKPPTGRNSAKGLRPAPRAFVPKNLEVFQCPECGSRKIEGEWETAPRPNAATPWERNCWIILCAGCGLQIPALLGRRWQGRTIEQARLEWLQTYRRHALKFSACI
jgi:hypothetical protein